MSLTEPEDVGLVDILAVIAAYATTHPFRFALLLCFAGLFSGAGQSLISHLF